jgi:hypothetical protein
MICESSVGPEREHWISQELGDDWTHGANIEPA